jgi:hypothetical protein
MTIKLPPRNSEEPIFFSEGKKVKNSKTFQKYLFKCQRQFPEKTRARKIVKIVRTSAESGINFNSTLSSTLFKYFVTKNYL